VIQVPVEEEAGCLGAAMQAMYAYRHSSGSAETMAAIAEHCVAISSDKKQDPRPDLVEAYRSSMDKYQRLLNELYLQKSC
jgi:xylulokinase